MTYTQMLFALAFDKIIFGHTPDLISIAGSTLIVGSAIYVATFANAGQTDDDKEQTEGSHARQTDEEAGQGLISGMTDVRAGEDHDRIPRGRPIEEVQMRALR